MHENFEFMTAEIAGVASRLEQLEREIASEKRAAARTPGGLLVPKTVNLPTQNTAHIEAAHNDLAKALSRLEDRVADLAEMVSKIARVQTYHQRTIEELSLMSTLVE